MSKDDAEAALRKTIASYINYDWVINETETLRMLVQLQVVTTQQVPGGFKDNTICYYRDNLAMTTDMLRFSSNGNDNPKISVHIASGGDTTWNGSFYIPSSVKKGRFYKDVDYCGVSSRMLAAFGSIDYGFASGSTGSKITGLAKPFVVIALNLDNLTDLVQSMSTNYKALTNYYNRLAIAYPKTDDENTGL